MTRQEIMDNYAKDEGYNNIIDLLENSRNLYLHVNNIVYLIQEELKKKIANEQDLEGIQHIILNTENI